MVRGRTAALVVAGALAAAPRAHADPDDGRAPGLMTFLAARGDHALDDELWSLYGQETTIYDYKPAVSAAYTDRGGSNHSLRASAEGSYSTTLTLFAALSPWPGAEVFVVPELLGEIPMSDLTGLGGAVQNAELQKTGAAYPRPYLSRLYLRQTFDLGGAAIAKASGPMQMGKTVAARRLVLTAGNFSVLDVFDKNSFAGDLRRQSMNMAFMTYAAYDFAADARGYGWGAVAELFWDAWAVRVGRLTPPQLPNQLALDFHLWRAYGDQLELEHEYELGGRPGAVRVLGYRNRETMGRFADAVAALDADPTHNAAACPGFSYGSTNPTAPDLCWVRAPTTKLGVGVNLEQQITPDLGLFARGMYSDGQSEVYAFVSSDRSVSLGALGRGGPWGRPADSAGLALGVSWISAEHAAYLARGGVDGFIGDGGLRQSAEVIVEGFYSLGVTRWLWLSPDLQEVWHPAYNADRGPVTFVGGRAHGEF